MTGKPFNGLLEASFRGIRFYLDYGIDHEAGRRIQTTIFPGIDPDADDDFGKHNGEISIRGFVVGDNYKSQEKRLRKAFETPGPGTLVHPWLGELLVILIEPAQFSFSEKHLRVCRFEFSVKRSYDSLSLLPSSLSGLIAAIGEVITAAQILFTSVMGVRELSLASWSAGRDFAQQSVTLLQEKAAASKGSAVFEAAFEKPVKAFEKALGNETTIEGIAELAGSYCILPRVLADASQTPPKAAVGLGPSGTTPIAPGEKTGVHILMETIKEVTKDIGATDTEKTAQSVFELSCLASASTLMTEIRYDTRLQARKALDEIISRMDAALERLTVFSALFPSASATAITALEQLRAMVTIDMNEVIGRLPELMDYHVHTPLSVFILANHFYGDIPGSVIPGMQDLIMRNTPKHAGAIADWIEVKQHV